VIIVSHDHRIREAADRVLWLEDGRFKDIGRLARDPVCGMAVEEAGGYDESYAPAEDVKLWAELVLRRRMATVIPEPLVRYRLHDGQQSVTKAEAQRRNIWRAQEYLLRRCCPHGELERVARLLRRESAAREPDGAAGGLGRAMRSLERAVARLTEMLRLTQAERRGFDRVMRRWFGPGYALWPLWAGLPDPFCGWMAQASSPLLMPGVRTRLGSIGKARNALSRLEALRLNRSLRAARRRGARGAAPGADTQREAFNEAGAAERPQSTHVSA
jgi:hypothetical protein